MQEINTPHQCLIVFPREAVPETKVFVTPYSQEIWLHYDYGYTMVILKQMKTYKNKK